MLLRHAAPPLAQRLKYRFLRRGTGLRRLAGVRLGPDLAAAVAPAARPAGGRARRELASQREPPCAREHLAACWHEPQHVEVLVIHRHEAQRDELAQHGAPLRLAQVGADAKGGHVLVPTLQHLLRALAHQHVDDLLRAEGEAAVLFAAVDAREQLLRRLGTVELVGRCEAVVAVAARAAGLAEIIEQVLPPAAHGLAQAEHGIELCRGDPLVGLLCLGQLDEPALLHYVGEAVDHPGLGGQPVAPSAAGLLVVALHALRQIQVRDETHVGLVDAHAEGNGGHHHHAVFLDEPVLPLLALGGGEAGVIGERVDAVVDQHLRRLLHRPARETVDDPALAAMLVADETQQLAARIVLAGDGVADVRAVEALHELARVLQLQARDDLAPRGGVGRGRERDARYAGVTFSEHRELQVFGAEVVPPLRDAMRLVDGEQRELHGIEQPEAALGDETFGCHVEQVELPRLRAALDGLRLAPLQRRVEEGGAHTRLLQRRHLILHQRDQRRNHHAHTLAQQRGHLIAQRLAAARGHEHQRIAAIGEVRDDVGLRTAKGGVAEDVVENLERASGGNGHEDLRRGTVDYRIAVPSRPAEFLGQSLRVRTRAGRRPSRPPARVQ